MGIVRNYLGDNKRGPQDRGMQFRIHPAPGRVNPVILNGNSGKRELSFVLRTNILRAGIIALVLMRSISIHTHTRMK